jgi:PAS domain S-box-containing protein
MSEAARRARPPRLRIPLWDDYGQSERFAGVLALAALFAAVPYLLAERMVVAEICFALAAVLLGLCTWSARGGPHSVLGIGTPIAMTIGALALLAVTAGTCVASAALLALVPAVAVLWGGLERIGWLFLMTTLASSVAVSLLAPGEVVSGAEPWIADARAPWLTAPLALALFLLARSWASAHGAWQEEVIATHTVLAASEARFKAYVENAYDVTAELDARGRVLFITAKRESQYALPVAELLGTNGGDYLHPDDLPIARRAFEAAALGHARVSEPIRYRGSREGWRYLRVAVSSYRTQAGKLRFVLQARDETAVVAAQIERDRRAAELEVALARSEALLSQHACPRCSERTAS